MQKLTLLACFLGLSGCSTLLAPLGSMDSTTPEQIKILNDNGQYFVKCLVVAGGPPISGRITVLTVPKDKPISIQFTPDCQIKSAIIGAIVGAVEK